MLFGCGIDIIENARIDKILKENRDLFLQKIFSTQETLIIEEKKFDYIKIAVRFAAKEAFAKALGTGFGEFLSFKEVQILQNESKKPVIELIEKSQQNFIKIIDNKKHQIHCSFSHEKNYSVAQVIIEVL